MFFYCKTLQNNNGISRFFNKKLLTKKTSSDIIYDVQLFFETKLKI